jgi:hypothetical protein
MDPQQILETLTENATPEEMLAMAAELRMQAHDVLEETPARAVSLVKAAHIIDCARVLLASLEAHPPKAAERTTKAGAIAKSQKTKAPGLPKVKHVYGSAGLCEVDHDGSGTCGKLRERKPRAGSEASVGVEDTRTMAIPGTEVEGGAS